MQEFLVKQIIPDQLLDLHCADQVHGCLLSFAQDTEARIAERIARVREISIQTGLPIAVIADVQWTQAPPTDLAIALARGVDWVLVSGIQSLQDLKQCQSLLQSGRKYVPLLVHIDSQTPVNLAEDLILSSEGLWISGIENESICLSLAHQHNKLSILDISNGNRVPHPICHAIFRSEIQSPRPEFTPIPDPISINQDILWASFALCSRREKSKLVILCESFAEIALVSSFAFQHDICIICRNPSILRAVNLFYGKPIILDVSHGSIDEMLNSCEEKLIALHWIQPGESIIFVTENHSTIRCKNL